MSSIRPVLGLAVLAAGLVLLGSAPAASLGLLAGKKLTGTLVGVDAGIVSFKDANGGLAKVPVKEIASIELNPKPAPIPAATERDEVELIDGTVLSVKGIRIKGKKLEVEFLPGPAGVSAPTADIDLRTVFGWMRHAEDPKAKPDWKQAVSNRGKRDQIVLRGAEGGLDPVNGTVIEGTEAGDTFEFEREADGKRIPFRISRVSAGLLFNQPPRDIIPPTLCKVRDVFGNVLFAQAVNVSESKIAITTVSGAKIEYPLNGIASLDFAEQNVVYLADSGLEPKVDAPEEIPGEPRLTFLRDRNLEGNLLRLDGVTYQKGLWVFPDTSLTFNLNGEYREFKAMVGVDDRVSVANSTALVTIEADGRTVFSETVTRKDKPKSITLDVKLVKQLKLTVDRDALFLGNQVNFAEARVQK